MMSDDAALSGNGYALTPAQRKRVDGITSSILLPHLGHPDLQLRRERPPRRTVDPRRCTILDSRQYRLAPRDSNPRPFEQSAAGIVSPNFANRMRVPATWSLLSRSGTLWVSLTGSSFHM